MSTLTEARAVRTPRGVDERLRIAILVISFIGIGIGAYLTYVHYAGLKVACLASGGCETVQSSKWSKLDGIPVATLGLVGYVAIFFLSWLRSEISRVAVFGITLIGFLFSAYLTYRELFSIHAICEWCVSSAVLMTLLLILSATRVIRAPAPVR